MASRVRSESRVFVTAASKRFAVTVFPEPRLALVAMP